MELAGRHALVCGASKGIGRATAVTLARRGAHVTALARSADRLDSLVAQLRDEGVVARALTADLDHHDALLARVDQLVRTNGTVHIVVHNTGGPAAGPLLDAPADALAAAFHRHVLSAHLLAQRLLPGMVASGYGRFVNVLSTSVYEPLPGLGVSNTIRAAMAGWAKSLANELPPGVTINNVLPGFTDTERLTELQGEVVERTGQDPDAVEADWMALVPEGRRARPEETAATIAFLASPDAACIRGASLAVDGGRLRGI